MIVRRCTKDDLEAIYKIEKESFSDPLKKETVERDLARESYYCYGLFDTELMTFVSYEKVFDEGQIISVATAPPFRRKGFSKKLFEKLTELAKKDGVAIFTLEVRSDNTAAIKLYKALGFKEVGVRKSYYENPICDAILMDLQL